MNLGIRIEVLDKRHLFGIAGEKQQAHRPTLRLALPVHGEQWRDSYACGHQDDLSCARLQTKEVARQAHLHPGTQPQVLVQPLRAAAGGFFALDAQVYMTVLGQADH
ncbi:hypothetical protein RPN53_17105 [Pseudomonas putida]